MDMIVQTQPPPITQADITAMIEAGFETLMPKVISTIRAELTGFEQRLLSEFVTRTEFATLHKRVDDLNVDASKRAKADDVEELRRELSRVTAEKHALELRMTDLSGAQREIRDSVTDMRQHQVQVDNERANLTSMMHLATASFNQAREAMSQIMTEQVSARKEREELMQGQRRTEDWIRDTDGRFERAITRVHDNLFGNEATGQIGLAKQITDMHSKLIEVAEWVDDRKVLEKTLREKIWNAATSRTAIAIYGTGGIGVIVVKLMELISQRGG